MHIVDCSTISTTSEAEYRHFLLVAEEDLSGYRRLACPVPFHALPVRLEFRSTITEVDPKWFDEQLKGWAGVLRNSLDGITEFTGLDKFYWREGSKCYICYTKPIVGLKVLMGTGFIESYDPEIKIENPPLINYDYQDASFKSELYRIESIIRTINY